MMGFDTNRINLAIAYRNFDKDHYDDYVANS